jgi:hypothetical protein
MARALKMIEEDMEDAGDSGTLTLSADGTFVLQVSSYASEGLDLLDDRVYRGTFSETPTQIVATCTSSDRIYSCTPWEKSQTPISETFTNRPCNFVLSWNKGKGTRLDPVSLPSKPHIGGTLMFQ